MSTTLEPSVSAAVKDSTPPATSAAIRSTSSYKDLLKSRSEKRRELMAQSLGISSPNDLTKALGIKDEKPGNLPGQQRRIRSGDLDPGKDRSGSDSEGAFVLSKFSEEETRKRRRVGRESKNESDDSEEDVEIDDATKVLKEEEEIYRGSHAFLKGTQSANPHNDYCQHFVDTGQRPQNFIRDSGIAERFEEYPKLKELIKLKDELVQQTATPPMYWNCDLLTTDLSELGCKFDVIIIEPPLEEYQRCGASLREPWTWDMIQQLNIPAIADWRCFLWIWCGSGPEGLDAGRQCLKQWGFRRCEDICWIKTNQKNNNLRGHTDPKSLFQRTKEHCLMGIKGTVRRSVDGDFIHANVDIDLIISEVNEEGSILEKPQEIFLVAEHFCLGRRRLHIFGRDDTIRNGWLSIGPELTSSNFESDRYRKYFERDGYKMKCTEKIEALRPKSPPPKDNQSGGGMMHGGGRGGGMNMGGDNNNMQGGGPGGGGHDSMGGRGGGYGQGGRGVGSGGQMDGGQGGGQPPPPGTEPAMPGGGMGGHHRGGMMAGGQRGRPPGNLNRTQTWKPPHNRR